VLELDVSPKGVPSHRLTLDLSAVVAHFLDNIPDVLSDLLEVAAYVLTADRLLTRGTTSMARMGAAWRRDLRFRIPVRCVELWSDKEVSAGLIEALEAVSEDYFSFDFIPTLRGSVSPYIGFDDPDARTVKPTRSSSSQVASIRRQGQPTSYWGLDARSR